jgi:hypothetical protein
LSIRSFLYLSLIFPKSDTKQRTLSSYPKWQCLRHFLLLLKLLVSYYLNFRVIIERIANMMATIQNRVTILLSW